MFTQWYSSHRSTRVLNLAVLNLVSTRMPRQTGKRFCSTNNVRKGARLLGRNIVVVPNPPYGPILAF
jgi:hypothetical protein